MSESKAPDGSVDLDMRNPEEAITVAVDQPGDGKVVMTIPTGGDQLLQLTMAAARARKIASALNQAADVAANGVVIGAQKVGVS